MNNIYDNGTMVLGCVKNVKEYLIENAEETWEIDFSGLNWSYNELAIMNEYFCKIGKKYGLLKEFKENCIC